MTRPVQAGPPPDRWSVERALRVSGLTSQARLVAMMLLSRADAATAAIPAQFSPSLTALAADTGLARSTVAVALNALEASGWVTRARDPARARTEKQPTGYRLHPGAPAPGRNQAAGPGDGLVRETDQPASPPRGPALVRETDAASPGAGHNQTSDLTQTKELPPQPPAAPREDIQRLCDHLAARIQANGSQRPAITRRWHDAARLMLDKDGRTEDQVTAAINWCQDDEFWRANILSMPKLRQQYDQLRLHATRTRTRPPGDQFARARQREAARHGTPTGELQ